MLKTPLVLTGYLEYLEPGVLRKVILTPGEQSFLITGDEIVIDRRGQEQRLPLKRSRALKAILGAIEAILAGKAEDLESVFTYELTGTTDSWSVHLVPVSKRMSRQLTSMQISGDTVAATSIRFDLQDGEWHQTTLLRDDPDP